jgi:glycine/D-amino acid oxidase-like deaminating enzyme
LQKNATNYFLLRQAYKLLFIKSPDIEERNPLVFVNRDFWLQSEVHETVIIGGGLMGSSAAWQLSKSGERILLLEQQDRLYSYGSSLGKARIARSLGAKGDIWGALHDETVEEVKQLIQYLSLGTRLGSHFEREDRRKGVSLTESYKWTAWLQQF